MGFGDFGVGDKVKLIKEVEGGRVGDIGEVDRLEDGGFGARYDVVFTNEETDEKYWLLGLEDDAIDSYDKNKCPEHRWIFEQYRDSDEGFMKCTECGAAKSIPECDHIKVWPFYDAPKEYRDLSPHGGDEDWLALIPAKLVKDNGNYFGWMDSGSAFGCCEVSEHTLPDGSQVRIGAHS